MAVVTELRSGYTARCYAGLYLPVDEEHRKQVHYKETDMKVGLLFLAASLAGMSAFTYGMLCYMHGIHVKKSGKH